MRLASNLNIQHFKPRGKPSSALILFHFLIVFLFYPHQLKETLFIFCWMLRFDPGWLLAERGLGKERRRDGGVELDAFDLDLRAEARL